MDKSFRVYDDGLSPALPTVIKHIEDTVFWWSDISQEYSFFKVYGESFDVRDCDKYDDEKEYAMEELFDVAESYYFEELSQGYAESETLPSIFHSIKYIEKQFEIDLSEYYPERNPHIDDFIDWLVDDYQAEHFGRDLLHVIVGLCKTFEDEQSAFFEAMQDVLDDEVLWILECVDYDFY